MKRFGIILYIFVSIILASCSKSQTIPPSTTPKIKAVETITPTPTNTPTLTPTPDPDSLQSIQLVAGELCSSKAEDFVLLEFGMSDQTWDLMFEPETAAFINIEYINSNWELAELFSSATSVEEIKSLICIRQSRIKKGFYTIGGNAYQLEWDVWIENWPEGTIVGYRSFTGGDPPTTILGSGSGYGSVPKEDLLSWLADLQKEPLLTSDSYIDHLAFSPDGETLIMSEGNNLSLVKVETGVVTQTTQISGKIYWKPIFSSGKPYAAESICLSIEDKHCLQSEIQVIDILNGNTLLTLKGTKPDSYAMALSSDGKMLAIQSTETSNDITGSIIEIWDISNSQKIQEIREPDEVSLELFFTPDSGYFVTHNRSGELQFRDVTSGEVLDTFPGFISSILELSPIPNILAVGSAGSCVGWECFQNFVRIVDFMTGTVLQEINLPGISMFDMAFSADGSQLAISTCSQVQFRDLAQGNDPVCVSGMVIILDLETESIVHTFYPSRPTVISMAFSPDRSKLITGDRAGNLKIWDLLTE